VFNFLFQFFIYTIILYKDYHVYYFKMPLYSDEINIFESYCKSLDNNNIDNDIKELILLVNSIEDEKLKQAILSIINKLKVKISI